jgi:hypothetical protein
MAIGIAGSPELDVFRGSGPEPAALRQARENLLVGWYPGVHGVLVALGIGALVAAAVLLVRTSASDFYRLRRQDGGPSLSSWAASARLDGPRTSGAADS